MSRLLCAVALRLPPSDFVIEWTRKSFRWYFATSSDVLKREVRNMCWNCQNSIQASSNCCSEFPHVSTCLGLFDVLVRPLQGSTPPVDSGNSQGWFLWCRRCADLLVLSTCSTGWPIIQHPHAVVPMVQHVQHFQVPNDSNDHLQSSQTFIIFISVTVSVI